MRVISILSQKGGAGKTTIAINMAVAAKLKNLSTAIIDLDPQSSATQWGDSRKEEAPVVISAQAARLPNILSLCKDNEADIVFIDTAPHADNIALAAARVADIILIPCKPSIVDLRAIESTVNIARLANKPACVVLNQVQPRSSLAQEAEAAIKSFGVPMAPQYITNRIDFIHSFTHGLGVLEYRPKDKAAEEITSLFKFISKFNMKEKS